MKKMEFYFIMHTTHVYLLRIFTIHNVHTQHTYDDSKIAILTSHG